MKRRFAVLAVAGMATVGLFGSGAPVRAADHGDSTQVRTDTRADINDLYVFASPQTPANTVLIMTVCPLAGVTAPKLFAPGVKYEFAVDTNADALEDQVYRLVFSTPDKDGHQKFVLTGPSKLKVKGATEFVPTPLGTTFGTGGRVFAGLRDDPFFFDLIGFKRGLQFSALTSRNFFAGLNTMAIVIEVPTTSFSATTIGVWARTIRGKKQIDRMGRPAINTALIGVAPVADPAKKDAFNSASPKGDVATFKPDVVAAITALGNAAQADSLANILLPDILTYDTTNAAGFLNGRKLTDDVIDTELAILSNGAVTTDFVANDSAFLAIFPYLANPNP